MIIPAGGTGTKQVNDTDCHAHVKRLYHRYFSEWFGLRIKSLSTKKHAGAIDAATFAKEASGLLLWSRLKEVLLPLLYKVTESLLEKKKHHGHETTLMGMGAA